MCLLWEIFLNVFGSGQSDVRSGTSMTTCCVVNANIGSGEPGIQYCMTKYGSSCPQIVYRLRLPKRLVKQWKEGFKKTGRTLSENGRPEIFATERYRPNREGWNLCTNFAGVLTDSGVNDFNIGILKAALFLIVCYTVDVFFHIFSKNVEKLC